MEEVKKVRSFRKGKGKGALLGGILVVALVVTGVGGIWWILDGGRQGDEVRATLSAVGAIAGSDTAGYARAVEPRPFHFPQDHGPHPEYRTEWWYLTGNLATVDGGRVGYQLTFFRNSLSPEPPPGLSAWRTNQLWMAHLAITDVEGRTHHAAERLARGAGGLAGARAEPFRVWLEGWAMDFMGPPVQAVVEGGRGEAPGLFPLAVRASDEAWGLELELESAKPPVFQGEAGWSQKGPEAGNASYYISFTRLPTRGRVRMGEEWVEVVGDSWMDREWSTSALSEIHQGWDWFSLQLDDGREIMFFELRREDGAPEPLNHGALVEADGRYRTLLAHDVEVEVLGSWASPLDGARYPSGWLLRIPSAELELEIHPLVQDQEMNLSVRYWEGAVRVQGQDEEGSVEGYGFVELTGYGEDPTGGEGARGS
jgi:predicted secreted hydrolase